MIQHFRLNSILRVVLLAATIFVFCYLLLDTTLYTTTAILGFLIGFEVYSLIRFVEKTNRILTRFLDAIKFSDFSQSYGMSGLGSSFNELKSMFSEVIDRFRATRREKEENYQYLQTVIQHVGIGLISFNQDGEVGLLNNAAKRLLGLTILKNIRRLETFSPELVNELLTMKPGDRRVVKIITGEDLMQLVIFATEFRMREQRFTLVSLQNIQSELEEIEMESWQKLIRVLTHEIMNSVTPITSLAATARDLLAETSQADGSIPLDQKESISDIKNAVSTIEKRSEGLLRFVDNYRDLTRVPKPDFQIVPLAELFDQVKSLMQPQIMDAKVQLNASVEPSSLELTADRDLVEQVLINLLKNSIQALRSTDRPQITLKAFISDRGRITIAVEDNGPGIVPEVLDRIFVPFFTTKSDGSGIGLSLARQIMRLHSGTIACRSVPNKQTVFSLRF